MKLRSHARAGIAEYWVVNLVDRQIEVYKAPQSGTEPASYAQQVVYQGGDEVPVVLGGQEVLRVAVNAVIA